MTTLTLSFWLEKFMRLPKQYKLLPMSFFGCLPELEDKIYC